MHPRLKNHPFTTNQPTYYTNSTFIVSIIVSPRLVQVIFTGSSHGCYKGLPSMNIIFTRVFFLVCFFYFHHTLFSWACRSLHEPQKFSLFVHSLVCPITHSFLDGFQPNLVQHFPQVCSTCHTIFFSLKKTLKCVCERLLLCRLNSAIT